MTVNNQEVLAALAAPFPPELVRTRIGGGGTKLSWVPARSVSERLDQVIGLGNWDFHVSQLDNSNIVHGTLIVRLPDGTQATRSDFGYETGGSGESLKEAASDALRRCASLFGVARYLYQGEGGARPAPARPAPTRQPVPNDAAMRAVFEETATETDVVQAAIAFAQSVGDGTCQTHGSDWVLKKGGISKAGKPYAAFWSCGAKDGSGWCRNKPSLKWLAQHPAASAEITVNEVEDLSYLATSPVDTSISGEDIPF